MRTKVGAQGGGVCLECEFIAKLGMFLHIVPEVGVEYFPPKGTYVFMFLLFRSCARGHGLIGLVKKI
jgi:hypothetical protein